MFVVDFWQRKAAEKLEKQLPEALMLMVSSLEAGFSLEQALGVLARETGPPLRTYVGQVLKQLYLGRSLEQALRWWLQRVASENLELVVAAILIHRQLGGNLGQVLERIADTIRDRQQFKSTLRSLTAQGRLTGLITALLPVILLGAMTFLAPVYVAPLTTTPQGIFLLFLAGSLELIGFLSIHKLCQIEY